MNSETKLSNSSESRTFAGMMAFWLTLSLGIVICIIIWQCLVEGVFYNCTDAFGFDFVLSSKKWVHHPVSVQHVINHVPMSEPDTIKEGWSISGLIWLRRGMIMATVAVSILMATVTKFAGTRKRSQLNIF